MVDDEIIRSPDIPRKKRGHPVDQFIDSRTQAPPVRFSPVSSFTTWNKDLFLVIQRHQRVFLHSKDLRGNVVTSPA